MPKVYPFESYDEYVKVQTDINKEKLNWVYVKRKVIKAIADDVVAASCILCHGTRNGAEQKYFKQYWPHAYVLGTEISDTATQFPDTVQWDMQIEKKEWLGKFDIVYSNAFDHCIYPEQTLETWKNQLCLRGSLFLEYSEQQSVYQASDPLDATLSEVKQMLKDAGFTQIEELKNVNAPAAGVVLRCRV